MDDLLKTHSTIEKVFVFKVPARTSAAGYRAADWSNTPIWSGRLKVVSKGQRCKVLLEHTDKEGMFASCDHNGKNVEPVADSSRYFVLRISNDQGRKATIGIGFNSRTDAFDFKVALQDWNNSGKDEAAEEFFKNAPTQDWSMPEGGIVVSLGGGEGKKKDRKKSMNSDESPFTLPRPPSGTNKEGKKKKKKKDKKAKKEKKRKKSKEKRDSDGSDSGGEALGGEKDVLGFAGLNLTGGSSSSSNSNNKNSDPFAGDPFGSESSGGGSSSSNPQWESFN